jgi:threonine aldolase
MRYIDLRSDTVTTPTPEMFEAMATARVGDDVYGEDPTVNQLQELAAEMMGKEAALFVPTGTMGNLAALLAHCQRGDEVILGNKNHTFLFEAGGISALGGIHSCQLQNQPDGSLRLEEVEAAIRPDDPHDPISRLVCLENTHNRCGGTVQGPDYTRRLAELAHSRGLSVHLDGARIFNAAASLGWRPACAGRLGSAGKGLCAPVGSVLCGHRAFIKRAHRAEDASCVRLACLLRGCSSKMVTAPKRPRTQGAWDGLQMGELARSAGNQYDLFQDRGVAGRL